MWGCKVGGMFPKVSKWIQMIAPLLVEQSKQDVQTEIELWLYFCQYTRLQWSQMIEYICDLQVKLMIAIGLNCNIEKS